MHDCIAIMVFNVGEKLNQCGACAHQSRMQDCAFDGKYSFAGSKATGAAKGLVEPCSSALIMRCTQYIECMRTL